MEEEIFTEVDPITRKKVKKIELTCILCSRNYRCEYRDYLGLLANIERIIKTKKRAKSHQKSLLSVS
jgi:hypothetical protein